MDPAPINIFLGEASEDEDILPSEDEESTEDAILPKDEEQDSTSIQESDIPSELEEEDEEEEESQLRGGSDERGGDRRRNRDHYVGRNGMTIWHKAPTSKLGAPLKLHHFSEPLGPKGPALEAETLVQVWKCFMTDEMLDIIVTHTNNRILQVCDLYCLDHRNEVTNRAEVLGTIGLLYLAGVFSTSRMKLDEFWAEDGSGVEIFRALMSLERFKFILQNLRFAGGPDFESRKKMDKLACVRQVLSLFVSNCVNSYSIGDSAILDEVRESFRGRCSFKQFMLKKPVRYGFKVYALCDARSYYTSNLEIIHESQPEGPYKTDNSPQEIAKRLLGHVKGSGRCITVDGFFASAELARTLLVEFQLHMVGSLSKKRGEIPREFLDVRRRAPFSTLYGYGEGMTLCSHLPENDGVLVMLSTKQQHEAKAVASKKAGDGDGEVEEGEVPDMINYYSLSSGIVDDVDEIFGKYTSARNCRSMPLTLFFAILNVAGLNAQIIYQEKLGECIIRRRFLKSLAISLIKESSQITTLDNGSQARRLLISGVEPSVKRLKTGSTRCSFCPRSRDRKTHTYCGKCSRAICKEHSESMCKECFVKADG
ncbi:piggyBac transposable element-derived protein 4-like [Hetaerina americana]|uniref:piggyBac transposable element-derived protein 4-like n=1 Tax=Hetaerina americana TaxID=62018 RepID=UPI003A7F530A